MNRYGLGLILALALLGPTLTSTGATAGNGAVFPPPPQERPFGQTYNEWAADWWIWALSQPASTNPILDETGAQCANDQRGNVWFLAGTFGAKAVTRTCTVPPDTALLFPIVNSLTCTIPRNDPPEQQTEQQTEESVHSRMCPPISKVATGLSATIDGNAVSDIGSYCEKSKSFRVDLPADPVFGPPNTTFGPCRDSGYYLMVRPLPPGEHTIEFHGKLTSAPNFSIDVTYHITVSG